MTNNILAEFKSILKETDWMDVPSKQAALDKVIFMLLVINKKFLIKIGLQAKSMKSQIGYPDNIYNVTYLSEIYGVI